MDAECDALSAGMMNQTARNHMPYMLLIVEPVGQREARGEEKGRELYDDMLGFAASLKERGLLAHAESLQSESVRVEVRGGSRKHIDGPFAETKEMIGGFFLLNCEDRATALDIAAECPAAQWASVEVRELGPCFT
jgi:hypothetical protein